MTEEQVTHDQPLDTEAGDESGGDPAQIDLGRVRDLVLAAHPDVVPEMVQGTNFDELMASVEPAREAYQRITAEVASTPAPPKLAAQPGQRSTSLADVETLSPLGKISEGLRRQ